MNRIGETRKNKHGTEMKVVVYNNVLDIWVEFQDEHKARVHTTYTNFNKGNVKNPYDPTVHGVGYIGEGKYKTIENKVIFPRYFTWRNLLGRCYDPKDTNYDTYNDCEVCPEWFNYQTFSDWYEENFYQIGTERMHLDKDILIKGNKLYSPETCLIVPQSINMIFTTKGRIIDTDLPTGIHRYYYADGGIGYSSSYNGKNLGVYKTLDEAIETYMKAKRKHICKLADKFKRELPAKVYDALLSW